MISDVCKADTVLVTANQYIRNDGALVMGRGAAFQLTQKYKGCAAEFGGLIKVYAKAFPNIAYGVLISAKWSEPALGIFQVKWNYWEEADLSLIRCSVHDLAKHATDAPAKVFAVNFPGIGNGKLHEKDVAPLLHCLPDNVEVWKHAKLSR